MDSYIDETAKEQDFLNPLLEGSQSIEYFNKVKDCDDTNSNIHPDAKEICNGLDDNCDGEIDENGVCTKAVYLCKKAQTEPLLMSDKFTCYGGEWCNSKAEADNFAGFGDAVSCSIEATAENLPKGYVAGTDINIYAYYCDTEGKCFKFNEKYFKVCSEKEEGLCEDGIDNDCDGFIDRGDPETGEPGDPDCLGKCDEGECDIEEKKWCDPATLEWTAPDVYCSSDVCGRKDPACLLEGESCTPDSCDNAARMICNGQGYWTASEAMYCLKCGKSDSACPGTCTTGSCDTVNDQACYMSGWHEIGYSADPDLSYCETPCGKLDSECPGSCTPGTCDTEKTMYCKADGSGWTNENYCNPEHCGKTAAVCGTTGCDTGTCAIYLGRPMMCMNNQWNEMTRDAFCQPSACFDYGKELCIASCPAMPTENEMGLCNDNLDNDCDGKTDCNDIEDCPSDTAPECAPAACATPGETEMCVPAGMETLMLDVPETDTVESECLAGTKICGSNGRWGECTGFIGAKTETCNSIDDDCDASTDEGCECTDRARQICGQSIGACRAGVQDCVEGKWGTCYGQTYASSNFEKCDGIDNDCDDKIDEGCGCNVGDVQSCGSNIGMCKNGTQTCISSIWGECVGEVKPMKEVCDDGKDNDCDGQVDAQDDECKDMNQCCKISCGGKALNMPECSCCKATCFDQIKNQGEEKTDCGGPCETCSKATCNDRLMNGDEEGLDCGGNCPPCVGGRQAATVPERGMGKEETDEEITEIPGCGDGTCDAEEGEDTETCPDDCAGTPASKLGTIILIAIVLIVLIGGFAAYKAGLIKMKGKPGAGQAAQKSPFGMPQKGASTAMPSFNPPKASMQMRKQKEFISKEDEALEKSMKEQQDLLKK